MKIFFYLTLFSVLAVFAGNLVENTLVPAHKTPIRFEIDLEIGVEDGEDHEMFGASVIQAVADDGDIYILDASNFRVLHFGSDGTFLGQFGKKGQGPGELQAPSEMTMGKDKTVWVLDAMSKQIAIFSADGVWLENRSLPQSVVAVMLPQMMDSGSLLFSCVKLDENFQQAYVLGTMGKEPASFKPLFSIPTPKLDWSKMSEQGFWEKFLIGHFEGIANGFPVGVTCGNTLVSFNTSEYKGIAFDNKGQEIWTMTKVHKPKPFTQEAKRVVCESISDGMRAGGQLANVLTDGIFNSAFRKAELSEFLLPISVVFPWDGGFGVLSNYSIQDHSGTIHLFDTKGVFQFKGAYHGPRQIDRLLKGMLYTNGLDEDDTAKVFHYKVSGL